MKVLLVDSHNASPWSDVGHRLRPIADRCGGSFDVAELRIAPAPGRAPVLAACGRERDAAPLIDAAHLFDAVKAEPPDLCLVPLRGGLAHGLLMGRACGELPATMRIALVDEATTRDMVLGRDEIGDGALRPLVADAMERVCLRYADALLAPAVAAPACVAPPGLDDLPPVRRCLDAPLACDALLRTSIAPTEICFVGAFQRAAHVTTFIDAVEALAARDVRRIARVTFLGPVSDPSRAVGKEWLGRRALDWPFAFRVIETDRLSEVAAYLRKTACVAFAPDLTEAAAAALDVDPAWLPLETGGDVAGLTDVLAAAMAGTDPDASPPRAAEAGAEDLCDALRFIAVRRPPAPGDPGGPATMSLCILHKDRPQLLRRALESVFAQMPDGPGPEIVVFDNASTRPESAALLDALSRDARLTLVRQSPALPHPAAMNAMARHATRELLVFLDDDNFLADGGLAALARASAIGDFDIVTSNLWLFDADRPDATRIAKLAFVGPAHSAGLFFNFFGDTAMAIRRRTFEAIGGFLATQAATPAPDWLLLARAQAVGARIGVLQRPAFHYRRDVGGADLSWRKYDQEGLRHLVLSRYGQAYDAALVARLAQHLVVQDSG